MKGEVISEDGRGVKYKELQKSPLFEQYKEQAAGLRTIKLDELNEDQRKAFFISILGPNILPLYTYVYVFVFALKKYMGHNWSL